MDHANYFTAFIDVLGFKQMARGEDPGRVESYFESVIQTVDELRERDGKQEILSFLISDAVLIALKSEKYSEKVFGNLLIAVAEIQSRLAQKGIWTRGGIAYGDLSADIDKKIVFGEALIRAYELEQLATSPRVIIDPRIVGAAGKTLGELRDSLNKWADKTAWNGDVIFDPNPRPFQRNRPFFPNDAIFVDYFAPMRRDTEFAATIFNTIARMMYAAQEHYATKYRWLVDYMRTSWADGVPEFDGFLDKVDQL